jgi:hypothetical protein
MATYENLVLITSIINTPNTPLSYWHTRSIYSPQQRFQQLKQTIESVKHQIQPKPHILLVECSTFTEEQRNYLSENVDTIINVCDPPETPQKEEAIRNITSDSKALGEGTMTMTAFNYLIQNNITWNHFYKISGRYWLNNHFRKGADSNLFPNKSIIRYIQDDPTCGCTSLYRLTYTHSIIWNEYLKNSRQQMIQYRSYENIFADFLATLPPDEFVVVPKIGVSGTWAPDGKAVNE